MSGERKMEQRSDRQWYVYPSKWVEEAVKEERRSMMREVHRSVRKKERKREMKSGSMQTETSVAFEEINEAITDHQTFALKGGESFKFVQPSQSNALHISPPSCLR